MDSPVPEEEGSESDDWDEHDGSNHILASIRGPGDEEEDAADQVEHERSKESEPDPVKAGMKVAVSFR